MTDTNEDLASKLTENISDYLTSQAGPLINLEYDAIESMITEHYAPAMADAELLGKLRELLRTEIEIDDISMHSYSSDAKMFRKLLIAIRDGGKQ